MASYVKSLDPNHLLAVGDEGFLCSTSFTNFTNDCSEGDSVGYTNVSGVDFMTIHDYPISWGQCADAASCASWGTTWIQEHISDANSLGKPAVIEEFGLASRNGVQIGTTDQSSAYQTWTQSAYANGAAGDMAWRVAPEPGASSVFDPPTSPSPLDIACPSTTCEVLMAHALAMDKKSSNYATTTLTDNLDNWNYAVAPEPLFQFDSGNVSCIGNDPSRLNRTQQLPDLSVIWHYPGTEQAQFVAYFWPNETPGDFTFATSPDGVDYTQAYATSTTTSGCWNQTVYTVVPPLGTNYIRLTFPNFSAFNWNPELGQATFTAPQGTTGLPLP